MKKIITLFTIALLSGLSLTAQNKSTKKADKHFDRFEFVDAAENYLKIALSDNADEYVYTQLAESYYNIFNTIEAERWYKKALLTSQDPEIIYKYSQMLKANGKHEESNQQMDKFASMRPGDIRAIAFRKNPNYLSKILEKGKKFNAQNMDINTPFSDFGGTLKNGKLYITSARNTARRTYGWTEEPFLDIYKFTVLKDGSYVGETLLSNRINTKHHEGLVAFSPDGNIMYFSRESFYDDMYIKDSITKNKVSTLNLYKSVKLSDGWSDGVPLSFNSSNYSVKNPSISKDGKMLYFASDMPGGYGNFDIYKATIADDSSLGDAINLGQKVNTEGQEMFPYISSNNTLYFASDGHLGLGGLDVFFTKEIDGKTAPIRNVGVAVNSNADDFAFSINEDSGEGFVSSNREGGIGNDDIYAIKKLMPLCDVLIIATITDSKTGNPVSGASVSLYDSQGNKISSKISNADGIAEYIIECETNTQLEVTMTEYESKQVDIGGSNEEEININIALDPIEKIIVADKIELNPIYFDFDKSNITAKTAFELDKLVQIMNKYPEMVIIAESHTDSRGSVLYNQALSNRRAQTTIQYVISKGIDSSRVSGQGKGESQPKVDCKSNCSEDDHELNRRSEFIIAYGNPNS